MNGPLLWSVLCLLAAGLSLVLMLPAVTSALFSSGPRATQVSRQLQELLDQHNETQETYLARFNGRSVFFLPPAKTRYVPPKPTTVRKPDPRPTTPRLTRPLYSGPTLKGFVGDMVWFHGDLRINVGEEQDGITVLAASPPWGATIEYVGFEYELTLFDRPPIEKFFAESTSYRSTMPGLIEVEDESADDDDSPIDPEEEQETQISEGDAPRGRPTPAPQSPDK